MLHRAAMLFGVVCLFAGAVLRADDPLVSISIRGRSAPPRPDFRTESNLVLIPVSVTDARNHVVTGLPREAFQVFEDRTEQTVVQFAREDAPLSVGIVFDSSESMTGKLPKSREAMRQFLRFSNPEDEFFLVEFASRPRLTVPFTTDTAQIQNRLLMAQPKGKTALLDAVCLAINSLKRGRYGRRALVLLSDGGDNNSRYTETEVRAMARESDLWIYTIGIYEQSKSDPPRQAAPGQKLLESLAEESGGRHFRVDSLVDLPVVAARISLELRNQYVLGYHPGNSRHDGKYHQVKVKVIEGSNLRVSWRPGYYGPIE